MDFSLFAHMERITPEQDHCDLREELIELAKIADQLASLTGKPCRHPHAGE